MTISSLLRFALFLSVCLLTAHLPGHAQGAAIVVHGDLVVKGNIVVEGDATINGNLNVNGRIISGKDRPDEDIFVQLWKLDQGNGGLSVTLRDENGNWADENAAIRLDEQGANSGVDHDGAPLPMLLIHDDAKLAGPTWQAVKELFDNYVLFEGEPEDQVDAIPVENPVEDSEIDEFLDAALATDVLKLCLEYINQEDLHGEEDLTPAEFKAMLKKQWFKTYTNHFGGNVVPHASGFEHVFVGEHNGGKIGGYHFWWKFALDHAEGEAESLGHNYGDPAGETYPWLATFRMLWSPSPGVLLRQPERKGFFVGASPELMLAYGTLALLFEKQNSGSHPVVILDGGTFEMVVHASTLPGGQRGDQIRSLFPILKSLGTTPAPIPPDQVNVDQALAMSEGTNIAVRGVIQLEHNEQFGLRLAESLDTAKYLAVKLPAPLRDTFNPKLNPSAKGKTVVVEGRRGKYTGEPGIIGVTRISSE